MAIIKYIKIYQKLVTTNILKNQKMLKNKKNMYINHVVLEQLYSGDYSWK